MSANDLNPWWRAIASRQCECFSAPLLALRISLACLRTRDKEGGEHLAGLSVSGVVLTFGLIGSVDEERFFDQRMPHAQDLVCALARLLSPALACAKGCELSELGCVQGAAAGEVSPAHGERDP